MTRNHDADAKEEGLSPQLEKDLEIVRRIVSVSTAVLLILVAGFAYNIIVGDGLTFVKPSDALLNPSKPTENSSTFQVVIPALESMCALLTRAWN